MNIYLTFKIVTAFVGTFVTLIVAIGTELERAKREADAIDNARGGFSSTYDYVERCYQDELKKRTSLAVFVTHSIIQLPFLFCCWMLTPQRTSIFEVVTPLAAVFASMLVTPTRPKQYRYEGPNKQRLELTSQYVNYGVKDAAWLRGAKMRLLSMECPFAFLVGALTVGSMSMRSVFWLCFVAILVSAFVLRLVEPYTHAIESAAGAKPIYSFPNEATPKRTLLKNESSLVSPGEWE